MSKRSIVAALVAVVALTVAVVSAVSNHGSGTASASRHATNAIRLDRRAAVSPQTFDTSVPSTIQPATYREVAVGRTQGGDRFRIFTGREEGHGLASNPTVVQPANSGCFGVRTPKVIGISCNVDLSGNADLQAMETTFMGHTMVSGLVSPDVTRVVITNAGGRDVSVPIHNGTFFFDSARGDAVRALSSDGRLLGTYELAKS